MSSLPTRHDVVAAAARLRGLLRRTPTLRSEALDRRAGAELFLKAENLQHVGAFKARGALNQLAQLSDAERASGVITYSSGNHAQAVALAAKRFGVRATICMPVDAPRVKVEGVAALGAEIVRVGTTSLERHERALAIQRERGGVIVEPFDHPRTIAGQGTATLELAEDVAALTGGGALDALLVPVGGGGLIAGACLALEGSRTRILAVEPVGCDSMRRSLAAGEVVAVEPGPTLADGLKPTRVGASNLAICQGRVAGSFLVDDDELGRALVALLLSAKVLVEPSGAAALAVALRGELAGAGRVGVLLSGGNVAAETVAELVARHGVGSTPPGG